MNAPIFGSALQKSTGVVLMLVTGIASAQQLYRLTHLREFHGSVDLNASGQVVGYTQVSSQANHALLWNGKRFVDLGAYAGLGNDNQVNAMNNKAQAVGWASRPGSQFSEAVLWSAGTARFLGSFGGNHSVAEDINESGHVVGYARRADGGQDAFFWNGTTLRNLGVFGPTYWSVAIAMNAADQIVGVTYVPGSVNNAKGVFWQGTTFRDLGGLGGTYTFPLAINKHGHVTGHSDLANQAGQHAFIWDGTRIRDLGTLGGFSSSGVAINDAGQVAGDSSTADGERHAFLWDGAVMRDLGVLGTGYRSEASAINPSGQVVGWSNINSNSEFPPSRAFISYGGAPMQALGTLLDPADPLKPNMMLTNAIDINARGQILAFGSNRTVAGTFLVTPLEYQVQIIAPAANSTWKRGTRVRTRFALVNAQGNRISDARAATLAASPCKAKFSATGPQTKAATCVTYNSTSNEFVYDWKLGTTGTGVATLKFAATYKFSMPETITTYKTTAIRITQ